MTIITEEVALATIGRDGSGSIIEPAHISAVGGSLTRRDFYTTSTEIRSGFARVSYDSALAGGDPQELLRASHVGAFNFSGNQISVYIDFIYRGGVAAGGILTRKRSGTTGFQASIPTNNTFRFGFYDTTGTFNSPTDVPNSIIVGQRYKALVVWDGGTYTSYLNGGEFQTQNFGALTYQDNTASLDIGADSANNAASSVDVFEYKLFNTAVSEDEYQDLIRGVYSGTSPVANYVFNSVKGDTITDLSDNSDMVFTNISADKVLAGGGAWQEIRSEMPPITECTSLRHNIHFTIPSSNSLSFTQPTTVGEGVTWMFLVREQDISRKAYSFTTLFSKSNGTNTAGRLRIFDIANNQKRQLLETRSSTGATVNRNGGVYFDNEVTTDVNNTNRQAYPQDWNLIVMTGPRVIGQPSRTYVNGVLVSEAALANIPVDFNLLPSANTFFYRDEVAGITSQAEVYTALTALWGRILSEDEIVKMHSNLDLKNPFRRERFRIPTESLYIYWQHQSGSYFDDAGTLKVRNLAPEENFPVASATSPSYWDGIVNEITDLTVLRRDYTQKINELR